MIFWVAILPLHVGSAKLSSVIAGLEWFLQRREEDTIATKTRVAGLAVSASLGLNRSKPS